MKKSLLIILGLIIISSCKSVVNATQGSTEKTLIKTVSIDQNCPVDSIRVTDKVKNMAHATYALEVCGKRMVYQQLGTAFMEKSKAQETIKLFEKP